MKKKLVFFGLLSLVTIVGITFLGCKKIKPLDGVVEIVDATFSKTSVSFQFVDAKTGIQLDLDGSRDIAISITGQNAADVVNNFAGTQIGADFGVMAVSLQQGVVPSTSNQVIFTVHAETSGYLAASKTCVILQEGHQHYVIEMVNAADAPDGITVAEDIISAVPSTGVISSTFTSSPAALTASGTTVSLTIPSGTKMMDKNSVAVPGNLTTTLAYSNPNETNFAMQFPGDPNKSQLSNGDYVAFKSMGVVTIDVKNISNGCEVKNFDAPVQMTMEIPNGMTDISGAAVVAGSTFGVYSYSETTGKWTHESDEIVTLNGTSGKLEVTFDMIHLSTWQIAGKVTTSNYYYYNQIVFSGSCANYFNTQKDIMLEFDNGDFIEYQELANTTLNKTISIVCSQPNLQSIYPNCKFRWYKKSNPSNFVEANGNNNQPLQTVTLPSSWCPSVTPKEFTVKLTTNCPDNPTRQIKPQCTVFAWSEDLAEFKLIGQMTAGELKTTTANFDVSKKYALVTFYQNKLVALTGTLAGFDLGFRTIDGNDIDLSRPLTSLECTYLKTK